MNKKISAPIAIGIILVLSIALSGFSFWQLKEMRKERKAPHSELKLPEKKDKTAGLPAKALATEGWQMYRNEEYSYEIKYPKDWILENKEIKNSISGSYFSINQLENPKNLNLDEWFNENTIVNGRITLLGSSEDVFINGIKAKILKSDLNSPNPLWHIHIADKNNRIFSLYAYSSTNADIDVLNQMLSTFTLY